MTKGYEYVAEWVRQEGMCPYCSQVGENEYTCAWMKGTEADPNGLRTFNEGCDEKGSHRCYLRRGR